MKRIFILASCMLFSITLIAQANKSAVRTSATTKSVPVKMEPKKLTMTWTTKSAEAKELAGDGVDHYMNNENEQAYTDLAAAIKKDPDFTVALSFMTALSRGETKKMYAQRTIKSAANKTAGEKLFASLVDDNLSMDVRRDTWKKLREMFPDGSMINYFYVITRATDEEKFTAAQDYTKKFPKVAAMYNNLGYYYVKMKDKENAKKSFEKYIELYPKGANPYDSMGEFYLNEGDKENAKKYYTMALERYPFFPSSVIALDKMEEGTK